VLHSGICRSIMCVTPVNGVREREMPIAGRRVVLCLLGIAEGCGRSFLIPTALTVPILIENAVYYSPKRWFGGEKHMRTMGEQQT
jgi:hypothetical protein